MSSHKFALFIGSLTAAVLLSSVTQAESPKSPQALVDEYRALRRACSITQGDQRRECFKELNAATPDYKEAKKALALEQGPILQGPLVGQAD